MNKQFYEDSRNRGCTLPARKRIFWPNVNENLACWHYLHQAISTDIKKQNVILSFHLLQSGTPKDNKTAFNQVLNKVITIRTANEGQCRGAL